MSSGGPPGINILSTPYRFNGNYTTAGLYSWTDYYKRGGGNSCYSNTYNWIIRSGVPVFTSGAQSTSGTVGVAIPLASGYLLPFTQSPYSYTYEGLPPGLTLDASTGKLYGTPTQAGTYTLSVAGLNSYGTASGSIAITIGQGTQSLTFTNPGPKTMSSTPFVVTVTASSGLTPTVVATTLTCSVEGFNVTMLSIGTCSLSASQAGSASYTAATSVNVSFTISKGTQVSLSVTSTSGTYGSPVTLATSGGSGSGAVSYVVTVGTAGCSIVSASSTNLVFTVPGTCAITATKAADSNFNQASSTSTTITIVKAEQAALLLTSTSGTFGTGLPLVYSGGSGTGAVSFVVTAAGTAGCSLATTTSLTSTGGGTCSVRVDKALDTNYNVISSTVTTVTMAARAQSVAVLMTSSGVKTYGSALTLGASGGSGTGAFGYSVVAAGTANCSVLGDQLSSTGDVGSTCTLKATRAADTSNLVRDSDLQTVTVTNKAVQPTLAVTAPTVVFRTPVTLSSSGGAGTGQVSFLVTTTGTAGCSVSSGDLSSTGDVGSTCGVTATKATSTNYLVASSTELTVTITGKAAQVIDFSAPADRVFSTTSFEVAPTTGSGLAVVMTTSTPTICTVSGFGITMLLPGVCTLAADQSGNGNFSPASTVTRSFAISRVAQLVSWSPTVGVLSTASPLTMNSASGAGLGTITYSVLDPGTTGCTIANSALAVLTFTAPGSCALQAEAGETATYFAGTSTKIFVISAPVQSGAGSGGGGSSAVSNTSASSAALLVTAVRSLDPILAHAGLAPGVVRVMVEDNKISVRVEANASNTGLDVIGADWRIEISAVGANRLPTPLAPGGALSVAPGMQLRVSGSGLEGLAQVRTYFLASPLLLGSLMTDSSGDFDGMLGIPTDFAVGVDTLQINAFTRDRMVRSLSLGIYAKTPLAVSGAVGSRIYFPYKSAALSVKAKNSLVAMIAQLPKGAGVTATVQGAVRSIGVTAADRTLASNRASAVQAFLEARGFEGHVTTSIRPVTVGDIYRDRRVDITIRPVT